MPILYSCGSNIPTLIILSDNLYGAETLPSKLRTLYIANTAAMTIPITPTTGSTIPAPEIDTGLGVCVPEATDVLDETNVAFPAAAAVPTGTG